MMTQDREALSMPAFDEMDDFAPRNAAPAKPPPAPEGQEGRAPIRPAPIPPASETRRAVDAVSHFPSREASSDGQLNLKGPREVLDRFRKLCKDDRRAYYDMLTILMDSYEGKSPR